jgi:hypothetical protein
MRPLELPREIHRDAQCVLEHGAQNAGVRHNHDSFTSDPKYGLGRGLSAKRLLHVLTKHSEADAVVSFIGAPNLADDELEQVSKAHPKFIAEARSPERTLKLLEKQVLRVAIVSRFVFPAPGRKHPRTKREWFDRYFQVMTPAIAQHGASNRVAFTSQYASASANRSLQRTGCEPWQRSGGKGMRLPAPRIVRVFRLV